MKITIRQIRKLISETIEEKSDKNVNLDISPSLSRCRGMQDLIVEFCNYTSDILNIPRDMVNIKIVDDRESSGIRTTAYYNPNNHEVGVYGKNRAVVDVCRSIAHELTHMQQMLENRISFPVQDVGGEIEDEANARAGEIIKSFAQSDESRKSIYEAISPLL